MKLVHGLPSIQTEMFVVSSLSFISLLGFPIIPSNCSLPSHMKKKKKNKVNLQQKIKQYLCISTKMPEGLLQETQELWYEALKECS